MAFSVTITDILNQWNEFGIFSYVLPFLLIFAVVFGILQKTKIFGDPTDAKGINAIIALSIGALALLNDHVSIFFANIFPKLGIGLSILLTLIIFLALFSPDLTKKGLPAIGWVLGVGVSLWALTSWDEWGEYANLGIWFNDYFWSILILAVLGLLIFWIVGGKGAGSSSHG